MVFWIFIAAVGASILIGLIVMLVEKRFHSRWQYDWGTFGFGIFIALIIAVVGVFVISIGAGASARSEATLQDTYTLRALVTQSETESSAEAVFFLGFGYANSDTTTVSSISYIQMADDGGSTLQRASIDQSVIYEGSEKPYVEDWVTTNTTTDLFIPWQVDWVTSGEPLHKFHIPEGTILEQYEVTP